MADHVSRFDPEWRTSAATLALVPPPPPGERLAFEGSVADIYKYIRMRLTSTEIVSITDQFRKYRVAVFLISRVKTATRTRVTTGYLPLAPLVLQPSHEPCLRRNCYCCCRWPT